MGISAPRAQVNDMQNRQTLIRRQRSRSRRSRGATDDVCLRPTEDFCFFQKVFLDRHECAEDDRGLSSSVQQEAC